MKFEHDTRCDWNRACEDRKQTCDCRKSRQWTGTVDVLDRTSLVRRGRWPIVSVGEREAVVQLRVAR